MEKKQWIIKWRRQHKIDYNLEEKENKSGLQYRGDNTKMIIIWDW